METGNQHVQGHHRVFYAIGVQDGINPRFLRAWLSNGKYDTRGALKEIGGEAGINEWVEKIGIPDGQQIDPWDPGKFTHCVPTLILKVKRTPLLPAVRPSTSTLAG